VSGRAGKRLPLGQALAVLAAWACLSGFTLVRLWAVLGGRVRGRFLLPAAAALAALAAAAAWRTRLVERRMLPWGRTWKSAALACAGFVLGAALDVSYDLFPAGDTLIETAPFRLLCALGSGVVCAAAVLALAQAAREFRAAAPAPARQGRVRTALVLALAVNVVTALYYAGTATVYYWDSSTYWDLSAALAQQPLGPGLFRQVLQTVSGQEYNSLLALPISLVMRVLGTGRYVFLFSIVNLYVLPTLWGILSLGRHGGRLACCAAPMLLYTALTGFADVAAAGVGVYAFAVYTDERRPQTARGILTGGLLTLIFLLRRYFFFFTASFALAAFAALAARRTQWRCFAAFAAAGLGCSLFFGQGFVAGVLRSNYLDTYSAYNQGRWVDAMMLCRYFGYVTAGAALAGLVFLLLRRSGARYGALLCLLQPALCLMLFTRVQSHGQQHLLLYLPAFCWAGANAYEALPRRSLPRAAAWVLALAALASSCVTHPQPTAAKALSDLSPLPSFSYVPQRRSDIAQLVALRTYVDGLSAQSPKTAAVAASSFTFNSSIYESVLRSVNFPEPENGTHVIYYASVDKRDAFSWNVLGADYLMVGDPVQTHLGEENQHLITVLARPVLEGTGIGAAYRRLPVSFSLKDGVTVYVYERTREIRPEEYRAISEELTACYPEYAALYAAPEGMADAP